MSLQFVTLTDALSSGFLFVTTLCAFLYVNHLPGGSRCLAEKLIATMFCVGAFGVALEPFEAPAYTSWMEVILRAGTMLISFQHTLSLWYEIPFLSRRRRERYEPEPHERRGHGHPLVG